MIITGNSNIDCFNRQGFKAAVESEQVHVYWVGALKIRHFYEARPIGEKVRSLLFAEKGWKLLSIGTHDIFELYWAVSQNTFDETFKALIASYKEIFAEFNAMGKFGWLVFPQPFHQINFQNVTKKNMLDIARQFNRQVNVLCTDQGILVVNPLKKLLGKDGNPLNQYMQDDGSHMNHEGARLYLEKIRELTKIEIAFQPKQSLFDPQSENESFCSLLLNNLNIPAARALSSYDLQSALVGFLRDRLKQKDIDIHIDEHTELINSRLLNTLDLVETFTFATNAMLLDIPFDANLWELNTIQKIIGFLAKQKDGGNEKESDISLIQSDFLLSMRGDFGDPLQKQAILDAERRISLMSDEMFELFKENVVVASEGYVCPYGIVLFWIALNQTQRGDYKGGLALLAQAGSPQRRFPFSSPQCQIYQTTWTERATPCVWEQKLNETLLYTKTNTVLNVDADAIAAYKYALSSAQNGDSKNAIQLLNDLIKTYPDFAPAHNDLGVLYCQSGDNEKAIHRYEAAVRMQPGDVTYLKNLADFYYIVQKDTEKALGLYTKGLSLNPNDIELLLVLGRISIEHGQLESAKYFYKRMLEIDPQNDDALKTLDTLNNHDHAIAPEQVEAIPIEMINQTEGYLVSALVSTYNSERFIRGCLEDLEAQTIAEKVEIIVIDSASQQNERGIVEEFQKRYDNIVYIRTEQREGIYAAWNRGIRIARGKFITNTNTDDRRLPYALEAESKALEMFPDVGLVYADIWSTTLENDTLCIESSRRFGLYSYSDFSLLIGLAGSIFSPQPMWRKSVHDSLGYFDESYMVAGDYEFFYRVARQFGALHIQAPLGLYLENPSGIQLSQQNLTIEEFKRLRNKFYSEIILEEFFPMLCGARDDKAARGSAFFELGNNCMIASLQPEFELAIKYYEQARELLGDSPELMHNLAIAQIKVGNTETGIGFLRKSSETAPESAAALKALEDSGSYIKKLPLEFGIFRFEHPVAKSARQGKRIALEEISGLALAQGGTAKGVANKKRGTLDGN